MKKFLWKVYMTIRKPLEGRGLTQFKLLKNINDWIAWRFFKKNIPEYIKIDGEKFYIDKTDTLGLRFSAHQPYILDEVKKLNEGDVFVDVGANIGYFSFFAEKQGAKVYAIEPLPSVLGVLKRNINGTIIEKAVAGYAGTIALYEHPDALGGSSVMREVGKKFSVTCDTLDNIIDVKNIDLLKIDIEDGEKDAIEGMLETIKKSKKIIMECRFPNIRKHIQDLGFSCEQLYQDDYLFVKK